MYKNIRHLKNKNYYILFYNKIIPYLMLILLQINVEKSEKFNMNIKKNFKNSYFFSDFISRLFSDLNRIFSNI